MESSFLCGESAFKYILNVSDDWNQFETDILVLHAPGEPQVGIYVGQQIQDFWMKSLQERREHRRELSGASVPKIHRWRTILPEVICDACEEDVLPDRLNIICLDVVHLHQSQILEPLRQLYQRKVFMIAFALTNKMLMYPELLQRVHYMKEAYNKCIFLSSEEKFRIFLIEPLKFDNFLFHNDKPLKLFTVGSHGATVFGKPTFGGFLLFKKSLSLIFSEKYSSQKSVHNCVNTEETVICSS